MVRQSRRGARPQPWRRQSRGGHVGSRAGRGGGRRGGGRGSGPCCVRAHTRWVSCEVQRFEVQRLKAQHTVCSWHEQDEGKKKRKKRTGEGKEEKGRKRGKRGDERQARRGRGRRRRRVGRGRGC
eukprot:1722081-Rhodomonas_salina.5